MSRDADADGRVALIGSTLRGMRARMVTHVVLFKLKEPSADNCARVANALRSMEGRIAALRSIDVGVDELRTERSFDIALRTTHASYAELDTYQVDPIHQEVVALIRSLAERSVACDWSS